MKHFILIIIIIFTSALVGCQKDSNNIKDPEYSLSHTEININLGENATLTVNNAHQYSVSISAPVVSIVCIANKIHITAIKVGEAVLRISIGNTQLECKIIVASITHPDNPDDNIVADPTLRAQSNTVSFRYDHSGILYQCSESGDKTTYLFTDIDTNEYISFIFNVSTRMVEHITSSHSTTPAKIENTAILKEDNGVIWLKVKTSTEVMIFVVD